MGTDDGEWVGGGWDVRSHYSYFNELFEDVRVVYISIHNGRTRRGKRWRRPNPITISSITIAGQRHSGPGSASCDKISAAGRLMATIEYSCPSCKNVTKFQINGDVRSMNASASCTVCGYNFSKNEIERIARNTSGERAKEIFKTYKP
jgi:phage FluMu protein Com